MGAQKEKIESTVVGLKSPSQRGGGLKTGANWLAVKRQDDGAEGLWRIWDKLYDFGEWVEKHPGGAEWLTLTRGTDITEAFEVHHVLSLAERMLPKFYVRDAVEPRSCPFTFKPDGFYRKFKARAREALKDVDFHKPARVTNMLADSLFLTTLIFCAIAARTSSWFAILATAIVQTWCSNMGHNYLHQKDNFRMCYMDLSWMSSREWRIFHVLSHHLYSNTILDLEIIVWEPVFNYLPNKEKGIIGGYVACIFAPLVWGTSYFIHMIKRIYSMIWEFDGPEIRDAFPFIVPTVMFLVSPTYSTLWVWLRIVVIASFYFTLVGVNAAHHHPDIYHDGDARREDTDWGLAQIDAVRDRVEVEPSLFLVLTNFGSHTLHHLLPTVDHAYLRLCEPAFKETCKEFGVSSDNWPQWELIKGQFKQLMNNEPKKTPNGR